MELLPNRTRHWIVLTLVVAVGIATMTRAAHADITDIRQERHCKEVADEARLRGGLAIMFLRATTALSRPGGIFSSELRRFCNNAQSLMELGKLSNIIAGECHYFPFGEPQMPEEKLKSQYQLQLLNIMAKDTETALGRLCGSYWEMNSRLWELPPWR